MSAPPPRIATVTLNAAVDHTAFVPGFVAGEVNRVVADQADAGGKGVNVASFLHRFGHAVAVTGLLGRDNQEPFVRHFAGLPLTDRFVRVDGATRVNIKIVDEPHQRITDINFPGVKAGAGDLADVAAAVERLADEGVDWFVLAGSLPAGLPATAWRDLAVALKRRGATVVLDTSGPALAAAIEAGPDAVKPNIAELSELVGRPLDSAADIVAAARDLQGRGIGLVAVSMGPRGAIFVDKDAAVLAVPPAVTVKSTVGAGDAMVAGIVHATLCGLAAGDRAALATAFSLGALGEIGPRLPPRPAVEAFAATVTIRAPLS